MHTKSMGLEIVRRKLSYKGIVASAAYCQGTVMAPMLILAHGFGGCKEDFSHRMEALANKGFFVIAMDNAHFGERAQMDWQDFFAAPRGGFDLLQIRKAMEQSARDLSLLMDYYSQNMACDANRVALLGVSMGGYIGYRLAVIDSRVKVLAPMISSPYWDDVPMDEIMVVQNRELFEKYIKQYEPAGYPEILQKIPIFAQLGSADKHLDSRKVQELFESMKEQQAGHPSTRVILYRDLGHEDTQEMFDRGIEFIQANL